MYQKIVVLLCSLILSACATHSNLIGPIQLKLKNADCAGALVDLEKKSSNEGDDQLLYLMEYASALQICKDYEKSSQILLKADQLSEFIDYQSVSRIAAATLLNEQLIQYKGDKFEKQFINVLASLNYLELEKNEAAMVEVRRINEKIKKMADEEKIKYELNSFASYLSGLVYDTNRQFDDACISYQDSYKLDSSFEIVKKDMLTACWRAQRFDEYKKLLKKTHASAADIDYSKRSSPKNTREIILVFMQGWGPKKVVAHDRISFAQLVPSLSLTKFLQAEVLSNSSKSSQSAIAYNIEKSAIATLEADLNSLAARRLGARITKEIVADQIRQKDKALGDLAWLVMVASERADLRHWALLPETIQILRLQLESESQIKLTGQMLNGEISEDLGIIDLATKPQKNIYLIRSLK